MSCLRGFFLGDSTALTCVDDDDDVVIVVVAAAVLDGDDDDDTCAEARLATDGMTGILKRCPGV